jgi:hypothetical protein
MITGKVLPDDVDYFRRRAVQEQVAAGNAASEQARKCHDELAMMYRFKVAMLSTGPDSWADALRNHREPEAAKQLRATPERRSQCSVGEAG